jgi:hypothetical protein
MIWSKEDSENLKILTKNSTIIARSLAKMAELDDIEFLESRPLQGAVKRIEHSEYNPENEYEEELLEKEEKKKEISESSNQLWIEDEMDLED